MEGPELVMPAGDLEKLFTAVLFGADAVYVGGKDFSLRAYAGNCSLEEIGRGLGFARAKGKKTYVAVNTLAHNRDIEALPHHLEALAAMGVDGIIVSDPGVLRLAGRYAPGLDITISTQANVSNYEAAAFYRDLGASRIVLSRELSLDEIETIKKRVDIEIEVFVHGAMCVSYSGRCLLSHFMTGRSANQGACTHPCRYRYALLEEKRPGQYFPIEEDEKGSYILNSRDLCAVEYLPALMSAGVDAFKVEGRMKSPLYVASVARVYRQAIDRYRASGQEFSGDELKEWIQELCGTAARPFTSGFMLGEAADIQDVDKREPGSRVEFVGIVKGYNSGLDLLEVEQRANFGPGDILELLIPPGQVRRLDLSVLYDEQGQTLDRARHARQRVYIPGVGAVPEGAILRRRQKGYEA